MLFDTLNWFFKPDSVFATEKIARGDLVDGIPSMIKNSFKRAIFIIPGSSWQINYLILNLLFTNPVWQQYCPALEFLCPY